MFLDSHLINWFLFVFCLIKSELVVKFLRMSNVPNVFTLVKNVKLNEDWRDKMHNINNNNNNNRWERHGKVFVRMHDVTFTIRFSRFSLSYRTEKRELYPNRIHADLIKRLATNATDTWQQIRLWKRKRKHPGSSWKDVV